MDESENCAGMVYIIYSIDEQNVQAQALISSIDINECEEETHKCSDLAKCVNIDGDYYCECHIGFEGDGETCTGVIYLYTCIVCVV